MNKNTITHEQTVHATMSDRVARKITSGAQRMQSAFARAMNRAVGKVHPQRLKSYVIVFFFLGGGFSVLLTVSAVLGSKQNPFPKIDFIAPPIQHSEPAGQPVEGDASVSEQLYQRIQHFKSYMDSLKGHNSQQYDRILFQRPMLLDSVRMLENLYHSQQNTQK